MDKKYLFLVVGTLTIITAYAFYYRQQGQECRRDNQCVSGEKCVDSGGNAPGKCQ